MATLNKNGAPGKRDREKEALIRTTKNKEVWYADFFFSPHRNHNCGVKRLGQKLLND